MASDCSSENMYSTTVHNSEPCEGSGPGKMLVAREHAVGQAVVLVQFGDHPAAAARSVRKPETSDQTGPVLTACPLLTPWVASARSLSPSPSSSLMNSAVMRCVYWKFGILRHPVVALLVQQASQVEQIRRAGPVVEPDDAEQFILPAELAPVAQRPLGSSSSW